MATNAGQMTQSAHSNPQWMLCDGKPHFVLYAGQPQRTKGVLSEGNRQDYIRQVGWQGRRRGLGPLGWIFLAPLDKSSTWYVSTADDSTETTLVTPPTVAKPPAGVS